MAAISTGPLCYSKHNPILATRSGSRMFIIVSCENRDTNDPVNTKVKKEIKHDKGLIFQQLFTNVQKLGKEARDNLSPKKKGDWKDVTLMSLSFAVYVYMSQKIVCAYCAWMSMARQPW
ncbi:hypothetical protein CDL12_13286 [Handroanthus impetiginosus]|uniref:Uncharacterized protein n=1 Tax=Handroanthus impetiginosus TaxID=429701 RepID=A0A2G9GTD9_9LAMI|nr:hypothetical protein CDL12_18861 [Handroanthus impetiginosus]PIN14082.1 hypothetical protein CDL12_13286 [Handroanthus impetiginosus]